MKLKDMDKAQVKAQLEKDIETYLKTGKITKLPSCAFVTDVPKPNLTVTRKWK